MVRRRLGIAGEPRVGRDQVVGFEARLFQAGDIEGVHRLADQRELRDQVFRRVRPVRLVVGIEIGAEGLFRFVEHHCEMRRLVVGFMSASSFHSMLQKPSTALTCKPSDLRVSGGSA